MNPRIAATEQDDPLASGQSVFLLQLQQNALGALLVALSLAAPAVTLGVLLRDGLSPLAGVGALLTLVIWLSLWLFRRQRMRLAAHVVIFAVLVASVVGVVAHGTVRSAAVMVMAPTTQTAQLQIVAIVEKVGIFIQS